MLFGVNSKGDGAGDDVRKATREITNATLALKEPVVSNVLVVTV
jgi:hypothetical protein